MSVIKNKTLTTSNTVEVVIKEESLEKKPLSSKITEDLTVKEFDLAELEQMDVKHKNVASSVKGSGCLTIINHERNGKRIQLSNCIWRELGCPQFVKIFLKSKQMLVMPATNIGIAVKFDRTMPFKNAVDSYNGKVVLYVSDTVKRLTAEWNLDFTSNCCFTGGTYEKCTISGKNAVVITMGESVMDEATETEDED